MKILYTGFAPFGGEEVNPSFQAVSLLPERIGEAEVLKEELPTEFDRGAGVLLDTVRREKPDVIICTGQAGGRAQISLEYVAINHRSAGIPDNAGRQPRDEVILPGGPAAYFSSLPLRAVEERCRGEGIPAALSYTAGTFVCNEVMYRLLAELDREDRSTLGGFIHVPFCSAQAARMEKPVPSMELSLMTRALLIAGEESIREKKKADARGL